jgi:chromosome segregation ATPase
MANATSENRCTICNKPNAILKCGGCLGDFCYNHVREHRQELNKQLDEIEITRDVLRQILNEQIKEPQKHVLIQQIDQWEQESIDKIKQTAEETRKVLLEYMSRHTNRIESNLNNLTDRLKQSRDDNDFVETNLNEWNRQLSRLNEELDKPSTIDIVYNSAPLVTKICVDALGK